MKIIEDIDIRGVLEEEKLQRLVCNFKMVDSYSSFLRRSIRNRIPYLELSPRFTYESSMFRQMIHYFGSMHKLARDNISAENQFSETLQDSPGETKLNSNSEDHQIKPYVDFRSYESIMQSLYNF